MLYFGQPSTRTFLSFNNACQILGIKTSDIRSAAASSESKGESLEDTLSTFHSYTDLIIIRHANEYIAEKAAWMFNNSDKPIPVINAGSGPFEHPTQALLDIYTLHRAFNGDINNKTVVMSGDLKRGRTIRSLTQILNNYSGINIIYLAPEGLGLPGDVKDYLNVSNIRYKESQDFEEAIKTADVFYATRIQDEYDTNNESKGIDYTKFYLKPGHLKLMKEDCIILHPLPRRDEIHPDVDNDSRAWYWKQEVNGMWIRTALIAKTFECDRIILDYKD